MANEADGQRVRLVDEVDDAQWRALLQADVHARVFHEPWVIRAFAASLPRARARWLELRDDNGVLLAGLPFIERRRGPLRAWVSSPCGAYGGPVVRSDHPERIEQECDLLRAFDENRTPGVLLREIVYGHHEPPLRAGMQCVDSALFQTDGDFEEFLRRGFPKNRRNECRRSERRGLRIVRTRDPEVLDEFYPIYAERSRAWATEVLPLDLLKTLLQGSEAFHFFAAEFEGEVVGGHLCAVTSEELFAWVGTTRRLSTVFPSTLLIREEARYAAEHGLARLNLGSSLGISGVHSYKRLLGAQSRPIWIGRRESVAIRLLRRLRGGQ